MAITSLRGSTLPNKSFTAGRAKTRNVVTIAPDTATTFANGAAVSAGGGSSVTISNVSVTDSGYILSNATPYIDSTGGYIKITGTGFAAGCTVYVGGSAATSTTFINSTEVRAQVGAAASNAQAVYVVNTDNSVAILLNAITYSGTPSWSTGATLTSQVADISFTIPLSATSDSSIVYTLASGSSTPSGTTLFSNGVFAGTVTGITSDTNYSFTVVATDVENQLSSRAFTVSVSSGDQYFNITPLLLNGEANVWIRDSSTNNFLPTIFADTKPTAFSPYNSNWSAFFDGSGDYISSASSATLTPQSTFTVECWVYALAGGGIIVDNRPESSNGSYFQFAASSGAIAVYVNSSVIGQTGVFISNNVWYHVAYVRTGGVGRIYIDGLQRASFNDTTIYVETIWKIGYAAFNSGWFNGYISNLRYVNGLAVFTGNFTPQTTTLGNTQSAGSNIAAITSGSTFLTLQDNRFKDNGTNAFAITKFADTAIKSFGPFTETDTTTGSAYFDGTGDYLSYASNSAFAFSTGDFAIECWVYFNSTAGTFVPFLQSDVLGGSTNDKWFFALGSNTLRLQTHSSGGFTCTTPWTPSAGIWYHVAAVRSSGTILLFINGLSGTVSTTGTPSGYSLGQGGLAIGAMSTPYYFNGYITDVRIIKGTAQYTANFTPATSSLSSVANTQLLTLQYRTGENNHRFNDEGGNKYIATRGGNASQGTFSPFSPAGWSAYFDGTGDYLTLPSSSEFNFGTGDFTIEAWIYLTAANGSVIFEARASDTLGAYNIDISASLKLDMIYSASRLTSATSISVNTWTHIAVVRASGTIRMFINGVVDANTASYALAIDANGTPVIGGGRAGGTSAISGYYFTGYISNFRIVKGLAVYTGNFTPPTSILGNTQGSGSNISAITSGSTFLSLQDNRFKDNGVNAFTITRNGDTRIQAFSPFRPSVIYSPTTHGGSAYFDGTGDHLKALSTSNTLLPANNTNTFTIDGWVYPTVGGVLAYLVGDHDPVGPTNNVSLDISAGNKISLRWWTGSENRATSADSIVPNQWNYFAVVVNNNAITIYVNSTTAGQTGTTTLTTRSLGTTGWGIGQYNSSNSFTGYMSGIRWSTGIARTISSIPTAPPAPDNYTTLLFNFTQGGIVDTTARTVIETVADAKIANVQSKFGTGSLSFDGTGDYLLVAPTPDLEFGSGDFTIELWWYPTSTARQALYHGSFGTDWSVGIDYNGVSTNKIGIWASSNGSSWNLVNADAGGNGIGTTTIPQNQWTHIAYVRSGTSWMLFVNGSRDLNITGLSGTIVNRATSRKAVGAWHSTGSLSQASGYFDDFRITRFARYTANFTPPTQAHLTK